MFKSKENPVNSLLKIIDSLLTELNGLPLQEEKIRTLFVQLFASPATNEGLVRSSGSGSPKELKTNFENLLKYSNITIQDIQTLQFILNKDDSYLLNHNIGKTELNKFYKLAYEAIKKPVTSDVLNDLFNELGKNSLSEDIIVRQFKRLYTDKPLLQKTSSVKKGMHLSKFQENLSMKEYVLNSDVNQELKNLLAEVDPNEAARRFTKLYEILYKKTKSASLAGINIHQFFPVLDQLMQQAKKPS